MITHLLQNQKMETEQEKMAEFFQQLEEMQDYINYGLDDLADDNSIGTALYHITMAKQALEKFEKK